MLFPMLSQFPFDLLGTHLQFVRFLVQLDPRPFLDRHPFRAQFITNLNERLCITGPQCWPLITRPKTYIRRIISIRHGAKWRSTFKPSEFLTYAVLEMRKIKKIWTWMILGEASPNRREVCPILRLWRWFDSWMTTAILLIGEGEETLPVKDKSVLKSCSKERFLLMCKHLFC